MDMVYTPAMRVPLPTLLLLVAACASGTTRQSDPSSPPATRATTETAPPFDTDSPSESGSPEGG